MRVVLLSSSSYDLVTQNCRTIAKSFLLRFCWILSVYEQEGDTTKHREVTCFCWHYFLNYSLFLCSWLTNLFTNLSMPGPPKQHRLLTLFANQKTMFLNFFPLLFTYSMIITFINLFIFAIFSPESFFQLSEPFWPLVATQEAWTSMKKKCSKLQPLLAHLHP